MIQEINKEILLCLNSLTNYTFVQKFVMLFVDFPIFFLPTFLLWMRFYYTFKKNPTTVSNLKLTKNFLEKENLLLIFYSVIIWISFSLIIQQFVIVERPEEAIKWIWMLLLNHIPDASFPSDHATVSIAFLTSLFLSWYKRTGLTYGIFVFFMLISRIIVGVHWPLDIIVWCIVWSFSSIITFKYLKKIIFIKKINAFIIKLMWYIKL